MVLEGIFDAVSRIVKGNARTDDDLSDRLNHRYTVKIAFRCWACWTAKPV